MNRIQFHYRMVLVCAICGGCRSNQWRTVEGHVKKCTVAWPNVASRKVKPGEPHWRRSDPMLMNHTQAPEIEATFTRQCGQIPQTMRNLHIEARSSNAFEKNEGPRLPTSRELWLQKPKRQTKVITLWSTRMTANRQSQSLNNLLTI